MGQGHSRLDFGAFRRPPCGGTAGVLAETIQTQNHQMRRSVVENSQSQRAGRWRAPTDERMRDRSDIRQRVCGERLYPAPASQNVPSEPGA